MVQSRLQPNTIITKDNCAISLVRRKSQWHAYILVEKLGQQGLEVSWYDFITVKRQHTGFEVIKMWAKNKTVPGKVRFCPSSESLGDENFTILPNMVAPKPIEHAEKMTKEDLLEELDLDKDDIVTWACPTNYTNNMIADIKNDIRLSNEGKMEFQLRGYPGVNCTSWTFEKLKVARIDAHSTLSLADKFAVTPLDHFGIEPKKQHWWNARKRAHDMVALQYDSEVPLSQPIRIYKR